MAINYNKVGWDTTKYFNPSNMNHMDDGIKAACDKADANESAISSVSDRVTNNEKAIAQANSNLSLSYINVTSDCINELFNTDENAPLRHAQRVTNHIAHVSGVITLSKDVGRWSNIFSLSVVPKNYEQVILWNLSTSSPIYAQLQTNGGLQTNVDLPSGTILRFGFWYIYN